VVGAVLLLAGGAIAAVLLLQRSEPAKEVATAKETPPNEPKRVGNPIGGLGPNRPPVMGTKPAAPPGNAPAAPPGIAPEVGQMVPEIEGEDLDGQHFKLSDYRGKVVVLDFWGNW
jgi:hypothetical protein